MKDKPTTGLMLMILLLGISLSLDSVRIATQLKQIEDNQKLILFEISKRDQLDGLYRDHLSQCSFISRDNIYVSKNGYVKSHYHNGVQLPN